MPDTNALESRILFFSREGRALDRGYLTSGGRDMGRHRIREDLIEAKECLL